MQAHCLICDSPWEVNEKRENRNLYCYECRRTEKRIDYGLQDPCIPWAGDFDQDDNPMKNGKLWKPGQRHCNHKDCVQPTHITPALTWEELEAERHSIFYRTRRRRSWTQLVDTLQREKMSA